MTLFTRTGEQLEVFASFAASVDAVAERLAKTANEQDLAQLHKLKMSFIAKTTDFYRENRKLNIGIVGQVKAGKSSFLNTLLFGGEEVLPKASTPKTATLTKIEYAERNRIVIEYYSPEDWEIHEDNAKVDLEDDVYQSAREIVGMLKRSGIDPAPYLKKGSDEIAFDSYEQLVANLNDYVGEDGRFTPLVKAVTLYLDREELRDISIVDTPGLNDPIVSRTIRTKEFMEVCDVVFFLSQTMSFLDKSDWGLLSAQLPQKGVKRMVLIGSKYDSGLRDVLRRRDEDDPFADEWADDDSTDNIPDACQIIARKLTRRARQKVAEVAADLKRRGSSDELIAVIGQCREPILVSAMAHNMLGKAPESYNHEERNVYKALQAFSTNIEQDLQLISNMDAVQAIFRSVVEDKERILFDKACSFVPTAKEELRQLLTECSERADSRLAMLAGHSRDQLLEQKLAMENRIGAIRADVVTVFSELNTRVEAEKAEAVRDLRASSNEYSQLSERTGTEMKEGKRTYSTSKWYNPLTWGSTSTEYYTYEVSYTYLDVADALENLRTYAVTAMNEVETVFTDAIQIKELKRKLLNVVIDNFDTGNESYDSSFFRMIVERNIAAIEFPVFKLDVTEATSQLTAGFSGQIRTASDKANLHQTLMQCVSVLFNTISEQLTREARAFKSEMNRIADSLTASLLETIQAEFDDLLAKWEDREEEIRTYRSYVYLLSEEMKRI